MSVTTPTMDTSQLPSDQLTVIVASFSCLVFFVVIVALVSIIYRRDPLCCKGRSCQDTHGHMEAPPQYYSSRQTLVGSTLDMADNTQPGQLFLVGVPSSYHLPPLDGPALPRLPSYDSVRKKDRQRHIHMMIADRFGLNGPLGAEPPPTYEESVRQSYVEVPTPPGLYGPPAHPDPEPHPRGPDPDPRPWWPPV